jgi:hypothetical protein
MHKVFYMKNVKENHGKSVVSRVQVDIITPVVVVLVAD